MYNRSTYLSVGVWKVFFNIIVKSRIFGLGIAGVVVKHELGISNN